MTGGAMYEMYRLMAIAKYEERYVIPKAHVEQAHDLEEIGCSLDFDERPGHVRVRPVRRGQRPAGAGGGRDVPRAQAAADRPRQRAGASELRGRVNLLNWDGNGTPDGLFPPSPTRASRDDVSRRERRQP